MNTKERYKVYDGSVSAHCCFVASVVDTFQPSIIGNIHYKDSAGIEQYEEVCECFTKENALKICEALNLSK